MPSRSGAKRLRALRRAKGRRSHGMLLVEGPNAVGDAVRAGAHVHEALYTAAAADDPAISAILETLGKAGIEPEEVSEELLSEFADTVTPQGILLVADIPVATLDDAAAPRLLVLDAVQDPGNVGTLIRAAEALGAAGVVTLPGTADPWSPKVVRASAGALFRIPVVPADVDVLVDWCERRGAPILVAAADGRPAARSAAGPAALVVGNESTGVSSAMRRHAADVIAIPQRGEADSLNVAMAGAILLDRYFGEART